MEYEKPPADRGDVAKANKVPARQCDPTYEARHLTMYYSNRFITGVPDRHDDALMKAYYCRRHYHTSEFPIDFASLLRVTNFATQ